MSNLLKKKARRKQFEKNKNILHNNIPMAQSRGVSAENVKIAKKKTLKK